MPIAGDDKDAIGSHRGSVRDAGVEPVVVPLAKASAFAPGRPIFGKPVTVRELRERSGLPSERCRCGASEGPSREAHA